MGVILTSCGVTHEGRAWHVLGKVGMAQRILVVEDEPAIADTITYALRTEGFEVAWCSTAEEATRVLHENDISLIVLDVGLPDQNGFDLCKEIRKTSAVPIIFLTARTDEIDRVVGLEIGGDDYVPKPFSPRELAARVKAVLRRFPTVPASTARPAWSACVRSPGVVSSLGALGVWGKAKDERGGMKDEEGRVARWP